MKGSIREINYLLHERVSSGDLIILEFFIVSKRQGETVKLSISDQLPFATQDIIGASTEQKLNPKIYRKWFVVNICSEISIFFDCFTDKFYYWIKLSEGFFNILQQRTSFLLLFISSVGAEWRYIHLHCIFVTTGYFGNWIQNDRLFCVKRSVYL